MDFAVVDPRVQQSRVFPEPTEEVILANLVEGILYAVLDEAPHTYIYCAANEEASGSYWLGYRDDQAEGGWHAGDGLLGLDVVRSAFRKYLHGDRSWRVDFRWAKQEDIDADGAIHGLGFV
ncbi:hypothetical protein [Paludisphaera rhizosphaerae]|uniref:hypothetical protein n=1 Tax=Paludisphaera rhizosphaerae TaxID=2711216 RepID=UPI0013EA087E|nr:hypothetical protein [Paludisphaera rhizosphaerae]